MKLKIKNWAKFQHYKFRNPPWIKLHKSLLNDPEWFALSHEARSTLISCWILASENDGELPSVKGVAFRLRLTEKEVVKIFSELNHWVEQDASTMLASCKQDASNLLVQSTETETETETEVRAKKLSRVSLPAGEEERFADFWRAYPPRAPSSSKAEARKSWVRALYGYADKAARMKYPPADPDAIVRGARGFAAATEDMHGTQFIPMAATWLNQRRWESYADAPEKPALSEEEQERLLAKYRAKQEEAA